jgi:Cu+-exporting ATPase
MANTLDLTITGMSCASCVRRVEGALLRVPGVASAEVNLARGTARVKSDRVPAPETLIAALKQAGYGGTITTKPPPSEPFPWIALLLAAPLLANMGLMAVGSRFVLMGWVQAGLALAVLIVGGWDFHRRAAVALRHGSANMDVLVVMGADAAFGLSLARVIINPATMDLYFESAALIIAFVRLGRWLEARARRRTAGALDALLALRPDTARKLDGDAESIVPASSLHPGDRVALRPGERAPADLCMVRGEAMFDLSLLTGESLPAALGPGAIIPEGAINLDGDLVLNVTATGDATRLARIVELVTGAQSSKPPIQHVLDRVSAVFVPAVMVFALLTFGGWMLDGAAPGRALVAAISVLVIACPCALGLAAPVAIMAGTGVAARYGILIRDPAALEKAAAIRTVVFDKTGTLTLGRPELTKVVGDEAAILPLATALSRGSEHPLAKAILARGDSTAACEDFRAVSGQGVRGMIAGEPCLMGNARMMTANRIDLSRFQSDSAGLAQTGHSLSYLAQNGRLLGLLAFADQPRPNAAEAVAALRARNISVVMLTGDNAGAARTIGQVLGINRVEAGLSPEQKLDYLRALAANGALAMVGDGVNDAPALAAADLGIAMGSGSDVAIETAAITLMRPELRLVPAALDIARRTQVVLYQGLAWALIYNVVALPLAALGHLTPLVAGIAMACSSLSVVLNALRLNLWRPGYSAGA